MTPEEQLDRVNQLLAGLDGPLGDYRSPSWEPAEGINLASTTLWVALGDGELEGATATTERLVTEVYNRFDDLYAVSLAAGRPEIYAELRKAALHLRQHLADRG